MLTNAVTNAVLILVVAVLLILSFYFGRIVAPRAMRQGLLWYRDIARTYRIERVGDTSTFSYVPLLSQLRWLRPRRAAFTYVGEVQSLQTPP